MVDTYVVEVSKHLGKRNTHLNLYRLGSSLQERFTRGRILIENENTGGSRYSLWEENTQSHVSVGV